MGVGLFFLLMCRKTSNKSSSQKIVSEYDQEIPQSQIADKPVASGEILTEGFENDLALMIIGRRTAKNVQIFLIG